ncbi:tetratricopeptide repeat protein, partial [Psychrobacter sp. T6-1]
MKLFGTSLQLQRAYDDINLRALWRKIVDRLCHQHKLTLVLAACLCLGAPAYASASASLNDTLSITQDINIQR